ncbi:SGNH/GDSL hydrolase family protein [Mucilaginibacter terrae]|uniref:SGNH/GDSL hydrolase family protein n=1 Tax=Mucilaginibacter terrae TaxID=1955052 RepID=UPI003645911B
MRKTVFLAALILLGELCCQAQDVAVKSTDSHIHYMGRVNAQDDKAVLSWSGTSVKINFNGTGAKAVMQDERGDNYYHVIVDGKLVQKIHLGIDKQEYTLATNLPAGKHSLELFKLTEWAHGKTWFYGFNLTGNAQILTAPATQKRKIEFFGNSITCGYAVLDTTGQDRGSAPYEDNYKSYAAITARYFNAEYHCTARSGIGLMVSWFPLIMPEMYDRLDANDPESHWDFNKYTPEVVVLNLFQNDAWLVTHPEHEQFKARFGSTKPAAADIVKAYEAFVKTIRSKYPKAHIICALGSMDASRANLPWTGYIKQAVSNLNDKNVYSLIFPVKSTPGHPSAKEQQDMADQLIGFINKTVKW